MDGIRRRFRLLIVRTDRIKSAEYVILIRNHRETWAVKDGLGHGQAFMVGKISGCIPTKNMLVEN